MVLKNLFIATIAAVALVWSGLSIADEYHAGEFFGLDLSRAVLSPKPLGPAAGFAPGPLDVTIDRTSNAPRADAGLAAEPKSSVKPAPRTVVRSIRVVHQRAAQPHHATTTRLAHHHRNPLDAQAFDARIQVWPCKSGGICNWKR
jgi:hypothetical protein